MSKSSELAFSEGCLEANKGCLGSKEEDLESKKFENHFPTVST